MSGWRVAGTATGRGRWMTKNQPCETVKSVLPAGAGPERLGRWLRRAWLIVSGETALSRPDSGRLSIRFTWLYWILICRTAY